MSDPEEGPPLDMPGPDMAPRPRAITPVEISPLPGQFVRLTLQLAHDRCLFPRTGFALMPLSPGHYGCLSTMLFLVNI